MKTLALTLFATPHHTPSFGMRQARRKKYPPGFTPASTSQPAEIKELDGISRRYNVVGVTPNGEHCPIQKSSFKVSVLRHLRKYGLIPPDNELPALLVNLRPPMSGKGNTVPFFRLVLGDGVRRIGENKLVGHERSIPATPEVIQFEVISSTRRPGQKAVNETKPPILLNSSALPFDLPRLLVAD